MYNQDGVNDIAGVLKTIVRIHMTTKCLGEWINAISKEQSGNENLVSKKYGKCVRDKGYQYVAVKLDSAWLHLFCL